MRQRVFLGTSRSGFTILELLIATAVFSVILLICTIALLQIGRLYYRGANEAATQETARSIVDEVSQAIQFTGSAVYQPSAQNYCIGNRNYSFNRSKKLVDGTPNGDQINHVLVAQSLSGGDCSSSQPVSFSGRELMSPNMRLAKFTICKPGDPVSATCPLPPPAGSDLYQVNVRVVYGDGDLLCSPSANDCNTNAISTNLANDDLSCKTKAGFQFCAVSELSVTVQRSIK